MIPYLFPEIPGELFYSRFVRTMKLCTGTLSPEYIGASVLGDPLRRLGIRLPQYGRRLLDQIPDVHGLTAADLLRGSLFPVAAPFIDTTQRERLITECIESARPQLARWFYVKETDHNRRLRYCPMCAREDLTNGQPMHWRTVHQYPSSAACPYHEVLLVPAPGAVIGKRTLHDPALHIDPTVNSLRPACAADLIIARDLRWLLDVNTLHPGRLRTKAALRIALRQVPRYRHRKGSISAAILLEDLTILLGNPSAPTSSGLLDSFTRESISKISTRADKVPAFYEFSLLGALIDLPLPELMARAAALPEG